METILNRWRGTGVIFSISKYGITGVNMYALYLGLLFGFLTRWDIGLLVMIGFRLGESMGWGKWIGGICYPNDRTLDECYEDLEGYNFPYIHKLANFIIREREDYKAYCEVALGIRGLYWGILIYLPLYASKFIGLYDYILVFLLYAIGFPFACWLSTKKSFNFKSKYLSIVGEWETQEFYYGIVHFICNSYLVWSMW